MRKHIFHFFACLFGIAAVYHLAGLFYPVNNAPVWRHALFVIINAGCIYGLLKRPKWFAYVFFAFTIQQLNSHGGSLIDNWNLHHKIAWIDLSVVIITPLIFLALLSEQMNSN